MIVNICDVPEYRLAARSTFGDLKVALRMLRKERTCGLIRPEWRVTYFAFVSLARSVGHILSSEAVDSEALPNEARLMIQSEWHLWQEEREHNRIFFDFVLDERNTLLKEGRASGKPKLRLTLSRRLVEGRSVVYESEPQRLDFLVEHGPYKGREIVEVCSEVVEWWDQKLTAIELVMRKYTPHSA